MWFPGAFGVFYRDRIVQLFGLISAPELYHDTSPYVASRLGRFAKQGIGNLQRNTENLQRVPLHALGGAVENRTP